MQLEVYALSEHLCTVKCEPDWTGQQLKEAIEEATNYKELVGSQQLAVGTSFLSDSDLLKDLDGLHVSLTRRAHPRVRQLPEENLEPLALSLRRFAKSPVLVWVITRGYVFNGNPDETEQVEQVLRKINREYVEEMDWDQCEDQLLHGHLNSEMMDDMVPWKAICGISPDDIAAVLALQACYMWIGDGSSSVAALLVLKDNTLVSVFANVREAEGSCEFADAMVASIETGKTWEELQSKLPNEFVQALVKPISEWTFGPHRMTGEDFRKAPPAFTPYSSLRVAVMQLIGQTHDYTWTCGDVLHKRGIDMGHCSAFEGLWFCPTRPLCWRIWHHRLMFALSSCTALSETWRSAAQEAREQMTRDGLSFSEALDFFQWRFADLLDREMGETALYVKIM